MVEVKLGIIGGTGIQSAEFFKVEETKLLTTDFGEPSSTLLCGRINNVKCIILSRHGHGHSIMPTNINFRANILALKKEGCNLIIATTACGSLKENIKPGDFVVIDQFIDRTVKRVTTFYDNSCENFKGVCHIPMRNPFSIALGQVLQEACAFSKTKYHAKGTVVTIEGPRFSTFAESKLFQSWGASVVNMTTVPEVILANELGMLYCAIGLVTDYDCWKSEGESVNVESVMKIMKQNSKNALSVIAKSVEIISKMNWDKNINDALDVAKIAVV